MTYSATLKTDSISAEKSVLATFPIYLFFILLALNLERLLDIPNANPIEKAGLILLAVYLLRDGKLLIPQVLGLAAVVIAVLCSALVTSYHFFDWERFGRSLTSLVAVWLLLCVRPHLQFSKALLIALSFFPIFDVFLSLAYTIAGILGMFARDFTGALRLSGTIGAAYLGAAAYAGAIASAFLAMKRKRFYLILGLNLIIVILTASRTAFVAGVLASGAVLWLCANTAKQRVYLAMIGGLGLFLMLLLYGDQLVHRFSTETLSGRERIWTDLMYSVRQYPFFGVGLGHQADVFLERLQRLTRTTAAHNEYFRFVVEVGYVGLVVILGALTFALYNWIRELDSRYRSVAAVNALVFMAYGLTDNTFSVIYCFFGLVASFYGAIYLKGSQHLLQASEHVGGHSTPDLRPHRI